MQTFKFKQNKTKVLYTKNNKTKLYDAKTIGNLPPKFDKHLSLYITYKGKTFVLSNPQDIKDDSEDMFIKSKVPNKINQKAFEMSTSQQTLISINEIKEEYGLE